MYAERGSVNVGRPRLFTYKGAAPEGFFNGDVEDEGIDRPSYEPAGPVAQ